MKGLKEKIDNVLDDGYKLGADSYAAQSAYFLEAIALMMYVDTFHEEFIRDYERPYVEKTIEEEQDEVSESSDI